jgi:hypothetical protein
MSGNIKSGVTAKCCRSSIVQASRRAGGHGFDSQPAPTLRSRRGRRPLLASPSRSAPIVLRRHCGASAVRRVLTRAGRGALAIGIGLADSMSGSRASGLSRRECARPGFRAIGRVAGAAGFGSKATGRKGFSGDERNDPKGFTGVFFSASLHPSLNSHAVTNDHDYL